MMYTGKSSNLRWSDIGPNNYLSQIAKMCSMLDAHGKNIIRMITALEFATVLFLIFFFSGYYCNLHLLVFVIKEMFLSFFSSSPSSFRSVVIFFFFSLFFLVLFLFVHIVVLLILCLFFLHFILTNPLISSSFFRRFLIFFFIIFVSLAPH